jgi:two-component system chemotaxis response regulator CheY
MGSAALKSEPTPFRCIIADDSAFARKNIGGIVTGVGGSIVGEAANGREAVELYEKLHPDLVLLDITMPLQNGVDAIREIMEKDKTARIIVVSSIGHKEMVWKALSLGARHFITKPFDQEYAGSIIRSVVSGGEGGKP